MTFILMWITTFKNGRYTCDRFQTPTYFKKLADSFFLPAYRIDASIRPKIRVDYLERADQWIFDFTFSGLVVQCLFSLLGYSWMYALTRRSKLSILAAIPPFALNILYAGTHTLCAPLDVFVGSPSPHTLILDRS